MCLHQMKPQMENRSQIIIYTTEKGETRLEVRLESETVWLTQKLMAELFQTTVANINIHLKNIFDEGELDPKSTIKDFLMVQKKEGDESNPRKMNRQLVRISYKLERKGVEESKI
jgi:hypothetical protein